MPKLPSRVSLWHIKHLTMSCMRQAHDGGRYAEQGMNHIILTLLIAVMLSGCVNLSKRNYMMVSDGGTDYFDSSCGYDASVEWARFGDENKASFKDEGIHVSICAKSFYSKSVAFGLVVPLFPVIGGEGNAGVEGNVNSARWIKITNLNEEDGVLIEAKLQICESKYPSDSCGINSGVSIEKGDYRWVALPDLDEYELKVKSSGKLYLLRFVKQSAYSWWMVTV